MIVFSAKVLKLVNDTSSIFLNLDLKKEKYIFLINDILDIAIQLIKTIKYIHNNKYLYIK